MTLIHTYLTFDLLIRSQQLLHMRHSDLKNTGGDLKAFKYFWDLYGYE